MKLKRPSIIRCRTSFKRQDGPEKQNGSVGYQRRNPPTDTGHLSGLKLPLHPTRFTQQNNGAAQFKPAELTTSLHRWSGLKQS